MLSRILSQAPDIEVVGQAKDPYEARELIIAYSPNVIILDVEMPRMDGITFLTKLMAHYPVPVIMCSGVAPESSTTALKAIELGAIDVVSKPKSGGAQALERLGMDLSNKIRAAAVASRPRRRVNTPAPPQPTSFRSATGLDPSRYFIAIGASTGGTEAIRHLLEHMPADAPPIAIVQHMPEGFTNSFANRLNECCPLDVTEAVGGEVLQSGKAILARGGRQMRIKKIGPQWKIDLGETEPYNRHCPSVCVLFDSVAKVMGDRAVGILLTGMGADGAKGLLHMKESGALTFGQDQASCVVYGMPKAANDLGAVGHQAPPEEIPKVMLQQMRSKHGKVAARI